jgi:hypothetical protein
MGKRIKKDGKWYRIRRGEPAEIPEKWVEKTTHKQKIRKRKKKTMKKEESNLKRSFSVVEFLGTTETIDLWGQLLIDHIIFVCQKCGRSLTRLNTGFPFSEKFYCKNCEK